MLNPWLRRPMKLGLAISTAIMSYLITAFVLTYFIGADTARLAAAVIIVSVVGHELGHWLVLRWYGMTGWMAFTPILAWVTTDARELERRPRLVEVKVDLAGPAVNLVFAGIGIILMQTGAWYEGGVVITSINAGLVAFNLLPFLGMDGAHYVKALLDSTDDTVDARLVRTATAVFVGALVILLATGHFSIYPTLAIVAMRGMLAKDDPHAYRLDRSMKSREPWVTLGIFIAMTVASWAIIALTPSWTSIG